MPAQGSWWHSDKATAGMLFSPLMRGPVEFAVEALVSVARSKFQGTCVSTIFASIIARYQLSGQGITITDLAGPKARGFTWQQALTQGGYTSQSDAAISATVRLCLLHLLQPIMFFCAVAAFWASMSLPVKVCAVIVALHEGAYTMCNAYLLFAQPCYLLVDIVASYRSPDSPETMLGGPLGAFLFVVAPAKPLYAFVAHALPPTYAPLFITLWGAPCSIATDMFALTGVIFMLTSPEQLHPPLLVAMALPAISVLTLSLATYSRAEFSALVVSSIDHAYRFFFAPQQSQHVSDALGDTQTVVAAACQSQATLASSSAAATML